MNDIKRNMAITNYNIPCKLYWIYTF